MKKIIAIILSLVITFSCIAGLVGSVMVLIYKDLGEKVDLSQADDPFEYEIEGSQNEMGDILRADDLVQYEIIGGGNAREECLYKYGIESRKSFQADNLAQYETGDANEGVSTIMASAVAMDRVRTTLEVVGNGKTTIVPDTASLTISVGARSNSPSEAAKNNALVSGKVEAAILSAGATVLSTSYYVSPTYNYKDGEQKQTGYLATYALNIKCEAESVGSVIEASLEAGATDIGALTFSSSMGEAEYLKMLEVAASEAFIKAERLAKALDPKGRIVLIEAKEKTAYFSPVLYREAATLQMGDMKLDIGKIEISASVVCTYIVK